MSISIRTYMTFKKIVAVNTIEIGKSVGSGSVDSCLCHDTIAATFTTFCLRVPYFITPTFNQVNSIL